MFTEILQTNNQELNSVLKKFYEEEKSGKEFAEN